MFLFLVMNQMWLEIGGSCLEIIYLGGLWKEMFSHNTVKALKFKSIKMITVRIVEVYIFYSLA